MKKPTLAKFVRRGLKAGNHEFTKLEIQDGVQFRFESGAILNVYDSGRTLWQGGCEDRDKELDVVLAGAKRALRGPGLFGQ
jgi:hypothetical protein